MKKGTRDGSGLIVGVDLGDRVSRYCVLDQQGQIRGTRFRRGHV